MQRGLLKFYPLLVVVLCFLPVSFVLAEEASESDVRLVIDVSGSMKRNDPNNLRQPSVDLLMQMVPDGSRAGVWTFGKYVNMLVPHKTVDSVWRATARQKAQEINSVGLFTNVGEALEKAAYDAQARDPADPASIILLTDGMVDIDKNPEKNRTEWRRIVDEVLPALKQAGFTVHTIALSEHADKDLMQKLALATDGIAAQASNADELMNVFLEAFDASAPAQKLPLTDNRFVVDSSVEEFTALIFREIAGEETRLIGPDEQTWSRSKTGGEIRWHRTDSYDLITVTQPLEGEWLIQAAVAPNSRVTVVSDLNLRVKPLPNNAFKGERHNLSFLLQEEGKTVTAPDFLRLLVSTAELQQVDSGAGGVGAVVWQHSFSKSVLPANGVFNVALPVLDTLGTYELKLTVDGTTFERSFSHRFNVLTPFTAEITQAQDKQGQPTQLLTVRAHSPDIVANQTQVAATLINPKNRRLVKPLGLSDYDNWQTLLHLDETGTWKVTVQVSGKDAQGRDFDYALPVMDYLHQPEDIFAAEETEPAPVQPEPADEPESAADTNAQQDSAANNGPDYEPYPADAETPEEAGSSPPEPAPAPQAVEEPSSEPASQPDEGSGMPSWLLYGGLVLVNVLLLGLGYWLFRKFSADKTDEVEEVLDEEVTEVAEESEVTVEEVGEAEPVMDTGDLAEEEPPMVELDEVAEDAAATEGDTAEPPQLDQVVEDDEEDFGLDDLEQEILAQIAGDLDEEEKETFTQDMRKAQGLELPENEMDEAISDLIDELNGERPEEDIPADDPDDDEKPEKP